MNQTEPDRWERRKPNRTKDVILYAIAALTVVATVWYVVFRNGDSKQAARQEETPREFAYRVLRAQSPDSDEDSTPITIAEQELQAAIHAAADFLANSAQSNGQFEYRINLDPNARVAKRYNILRHAGTIYALATYQAQYPTDKIAATLRSSSAFLQSQFGEVAEAPGGIAVWSDPAVNHSGAVKQCKLGGNGLALVGLCSVEQCLPGTTDLASLRGLAEFILYLQKPEGSFHSKYIAGEGGRLDSWTSLYYPGEAALGLVMLFEKDADVRWRDGAARALLYLAKSRENEERVPADHWAMIATSRLLALDDPGLTAEEHQALLSHARRVCGELSYAYPPTVSDPRLQGCLTGDGRTTPTATRMEGLLAAIEGKLLLDSVADYTHQQASRSIAFLMRSQIPRGPAAGGIPRAIAWAPNGHPLAEDDSFNRRAPEIRIDYVQHALSAMMDYQAIEFGATEPTNPALK